MAWKRGLVARSCASTGREDVVREVKGIEKMSKKSVSRVFNVISVYLFIEGALAEQFLTQIL